jgi:hypothetical protein
MLFGVYLYLLFHGVFNFQLGCKYKGRSGKKEIPVFFNNKYLKNCLECTRNPS